MKALRLVLGGGVLMLSCLFLAGCGTSCSTTPAMWIKHSLVIAKVSSICDPGTQVDVHNQEIVLEAKRPGFTSWTILQELYINTIPPDGGRPLVVRLSGSCYVARYRLRDHIQGIATAPGDSKSQTFDVYARDSLRVRHEWQCNA